MATEATHPAAGRWSIATFGATILVSAFLLFQVQPLISKAILPWFGGCPAVWTTCMLFFQTLLFAGYLYAHLLQRWLAPRRQAIVHLAVVVAALAALPIAPGANFKPADSSHPTWRILLLLTCTVGLPYFALSATSPLTQAWFSRRHPGRSPYRLYALSNIGSLAALLSYPFLFEPAFDLPVQVALWSWAFVLYGALCAAGLACVWQLRHPAAGVEASAEPANPPGWPDRFAWLALPAYASLMLLAATNHICQDVAVAPFMWVLPLAIYLLSFIISFDHPRWYVRPFWACAAVLALIGVTVCELLKMFPHPLSLMQELALNLAALFFVCMVCHGELARLKPRPRYLTEFYLLIAAGGALGGLFVGVVAPLVFSTYLEWQISLAAAAALAGGLLILRGAADSRRVSCFALLAAVVVGVICEPLHWQFDVRRPIDQKRNFFGAVSVVEYAFGDPPQRALLLVHGRITHGAQFVDPARRRWATTYYGDQSGVAQAIRYLQKSGPVRVGAIGLGVGTLSVHAKPGDLFRFYEINPEVERMAQKYFTYLADCRGEYEVRLGDARLSLEAEPPQEKFNLLVLDAFSGDAIPTHLLTREAFDVYRRHLAPGGVIAVHVTNTYLRLAPVVRQLAAYCGMKTTRIYQAEDEKRLLYTNEWVLVTQDEAFLRTHPSQASHSADDDLVVPLWTDQYSNLFQILAGGQWGF